VDWQGGLRSANAFPFERETLWNILPPDLSRQSVHNLLARMPVLKRSALGACGNLFGGWLSDRLVKRRGLMSGRRIVGMAGLALSAAFMLAAAMTPDKWMAVAFLTLGYGSMDCMLPVSWAVCLDVGKNMRGQSAEP
jgi:hypothetical protein